MDPALVAAVARVAAGEKINVSRVCREHGVSRTVFYRKEGRRIAYTIVAGDQLAWPPGSDKAEREGTKLRTFKDGDRTVVTWRRNGRTCVLSATNVPEDQLLELAAWKGQGAVDF